MPNNLSSASEELVDLVHDGSATGCLCALAAALKLAPQAHPCFSGPGSTRPLFAASSLEVESSDACAERLLREIGRRSSDEIARMVLRVLTAMPEGVEARLLGFVRKVMRNGPKILQAHADLDIAFVQEWARRVGGEIHRFKGLLRFQEFKSGRLVALYEPDHAITLPLSFHFRRRLAGEAWMILDCRRGHAATWNGVRLNAESPDGALVEGDTLRRSLEGDGPSARENHSSGLWRVFHQSVAIETRANPLLQRQCMPIRYWSHLTEMEPGPVTKPESLPRGS